jgi:putative FmdB family regulatory protein
MPIYEYRCKACGTITEFLTGVGEDISISCSNCGSVEMEKVMSAASFLGRAMERMPGRTCCGREERCSSPPCSSGGACRRDEV